MESLCTDIAGLVRRSIAAIAVTAMLLLPAGMPDRAWAQADTPQQSESNKNSSKEQNRLDEAAEDDEPLPQVFLFGRRPAGPGPQNPQCPVAGGAGRAIWRKSGPIIDSFDPKPIVSFGDENDAIAYWKASSADGTGRDILAEMIKVFSSGFSHINSGTAEDTYVWPYHFVYPLDKLTAEQEVELYLLVPAEYRKDMEDAGGYIGFRAGIFA